MSMMARSGWPRYTGLGDDAMTYVEFVATMDQILKDGLSPRIGNDDSAWIFLEGDLKLAYKRYLSIPGAKVTGISYEV
jgi:hypothetical protein